LQHILPKLRDGKDFVIVGYSFGSIIAIELTRRLEIMNFKGRLVLIDGAPGQLQALYNHTASDFNEADFQIFVLTYIMKIYSPESNETVQFFFSFMSKFIYLRYIYDKFSYIFIEIDISLFVLSYYYISSVFFLRTTHVKIKHLIL